jgi:glycine dehydrogenase subunit 2
VLNANYLRARLDGPYHLPYRTACLHEVVFSDKNLRDNGVSVVDVAKRIIDYGFHPPTISFPLVVHGALMIEPTESESRESLDSFADALLAIAREARENPQVLKDAPHNAPVRRLDEVRAAKDLILTWSPPATAPASKWAGSPRITSR